VPIDYPGSPVGAGFADGASVKAIQSRLNALHIGERGGDPALTIDGIFGPSTISTVKLFQAQTVDDRGSVLGVDGVVGPLTWAALFDTPIDASFTPGSPLLEAVLSVAQSQVGVRESPLGSNRGPQVDTYLRSCGVDPTAGNYAWCAAFLYYCFDQAARPLAVANPLPKTAGVHDLWNRLGRANHLRLSPPQAALHPETIKPGMLFFIDAGGGLGHTGLVKAVNGVLLDTIEGNTTNIAGSREGIGVFERNSRTITGINLGFADGSTP
jgi:hypothetical protein